MTAICGRIEQQSPEILRRDCGAMLHKLAKFGGATPNIKACAGAAFGFSQHATLPEDEFDRQPLLARRRWLFVADVRLDNREELEPALAIDRGRHSDSAILFQALLTWRDEAVQRILGDFAFALFDTKARTLLLGRDPVGQRPLFYAMGKGFAAFASMPTALAGARGIGGELNPEALARALSDMPAADDGTYFLSVRKVLPGHLVSFDGGSCRTIDYWRPRTDSSNWARGSDQVEAYHSLLDDVVRPRLRRLDGPVASQLSSGLDSSAVSASAAALAGKDNVIALTSAPAGPVQTASPRGRFPDESALAADTASFLGIGHIVVRDEGSAIAHLRAHAGLYQEPYRNNINGGWISRLAFAARDQGCQVMLTGDVGNLTLNSGNLSTLGDLLEAGYWAAWLRESRLAVRAGSARWTGVLMNSFGHRLPQRVTHNLERHFLGVDPRSTATFVRREAVENFVRPALPLRHELRTGNSYAGRLAVLRTYDFGNYNKGVLAESGIDMRHPLLDRRAVEFSLSVPPDELFRDGRSRSLARRALAGRVPAKILSMTDRGYQAADWQKRVEKSALLAMVDEIEASRTARDLLDLERLRATVQRWEQIDFDDPRQHLTVSTFLPLAMAGGLFMLEAERGFPSLS